ncbi:uncharacterized protein LOC123543647 [Mercenaria mercenaria]|uniref:uncharacterized protein LOC123543647 n=1 Tax=Mercenaria mercenaria TaxID=6596 RepID=UPI00234EB0B4|nr:uncharacterized protein LOC123543647 [Mercenaria mercenaria]
MTDVNDKLADKNFQHWLKANLAINITKKGVEECVENEMIKFHSDAMNNIRSPAQSLKGELCSDCLTENVLPCSTKSVCDKRKGNCSFHHSPELSPKRCPKQICDRLREKIRRSHEHNAPSWRNTQANRWCDNPWEIAKCYMPPDGYTAADTPADTDLNGILSIIMNHSALVSIFDQLDTLKAREVTKVVRHSPDMMLTEHTLMDFLNKLIRFLTYSSDKKANDAVQQISQLKGETLSISTQDITKVLNDVIKENTEYSLNTIDKAGIVVLERMKESLNDAEIKISKNLDQILTAKESALADIDEARRHSLDEIQIATEENYQTLKQKMQQDLLMFNKINHGTISLSPLFEGNDIRLLGFYVPPTMYLVEKTMHGSGRSVAKKKITNFKDLLKESNREIYVSAKAGLGKTAFCKYLAVTWCQAHLRDSSISQFYSETQLSTMKSFDFLFLISLRDTHAFDCEVDEMIENQVIRQLSHSHLYSTDVLQDLLSREKSLIILDGLDEWSHPVEKALCKKDIPHRKARENCTILTTTRPWKLSMLNLRSYLIDVHVEIAQLDNDSSEKLIKNTISKFRMDDTCKQEYKIEDFKSKVDSMNIHKFKCVPLILTYLLCLWRDKQDFGHSNCEVYSNIIGLLLMRAENSNDDQGYKEQGTKRLKLDMPQCIYANSLCRKYYSFLISLGHLAFQTYFEENRECSLVFDISLTKRYLSEQSLKLSLAAGFVTQSRLSGEGNKEQKVSFAHKTFQEFFAALYMQSVSDISGAIDTILEVCYSTENVLAVSEFLIHLSGLDPQKASILSEKLCKVTTNSYVYSWFRGDVGSWNYFVSHNETVKKVQHLQIACVKECMDNKHKPERQYIEDFIIDEDSMKEHDEFALKFLLEQNGRNVKSVKLRDVKTKEKCHEIVLTLTNHRPISLVKLDLKCEFDETDINNMLRMSKKSLKCFVIKGGRWHDGRWNHCSISLSNECYWNIWNVNHLENLYLRNIKMSHEQLNNLVAFITTRSKMKQLGLEFISCIDHKDTCVGVQLDISGHVDLKVLEIGGIHLSEVKVNVSSLEVCYVGHIPVRGCLVSVLKCLHGAESLHVFSCGFLVDEMDVCILQQTIPLLVNVQYVWLANMNFGTGDITLSSGMKSLEKIVMINVKLTAEAVKNICKECRKVEQTVTIGLFECLVTPQFKYDRIKEKIRSSKRFKIVIDEDEDAQNKEFVFQTMNECDDSVFEDEKAETAHFIV